MRVIFMGTPALAVPCLELLREDHEIALVVTQPDKPSGRGNKLTPSAVKTRALALGLPTSCKTNYGKPRGLKISLSAVISRSPVVPAERSIPGRREIFRR